MLILYSCILGISNGNSATVEDLSGFGGLMWGDSPSSNHSLQKVREKDDFSFYLQGTSFRVGLNEPNFAILGFNKNQFAMAWLEFPSYGNYLALRQNFLNTFGNADEIIKMESTGDASMMIWNSKTIKTILGFSVNSLGNPVGFVLYFYLPLTNPTLMNSLLISYGASIPGSEAIDTLREELFKIQDQVAIDLLS